MKDDTNNTPHYVAKLVGIVMTEEDCIEGPTWDSSRMYMTMSFPFTDAASFKREFVKCVCKECPMDHQLDTDDYAVCVCPGSELRVMFLGSLFSSPALLMPASKKELDKFYKAKIRLLRLEYFFSVKKCTPDVHDDLVDMFN